MNKRWRWMLIGAVPAAAWANGPLEIDADSLRVNQNEGQATFTGNVQVVQGEVTLTADQVVADYAAKGGALTQVVATGRVVFTRRGAIPESATGNQATFNPQTNVLELTGAPVTLTRGTTVLTGTRLNYHIATGSANLHSTPGSGGRVNVRFTPSSE